MIVACMGHTSGTVDAGIVGLRMDTLGWIRPVAHPFAPSLSNPMVSAALQPPAVSDGRSTTFLSGTPQPPRPSGMSRVAPLTAELRVFDIVDLGPVDARWAGDDDEVIRVDPAAWTRVHRLSPNDAARLLLNVADDRAVSPDGRPSTRIVRAKHLAFLILGANREERRVEALFELDGAIIEAPIFDRGFCEGLPERLPRGQHLPETLGILEPVDLVVGLDAAGGREGLAVLGVIGA